MSANEGLQPLTNPDASTADPNVHMPDHVRASAAAAEAAHKAAYAPPVDPLTAQQVPNDPPTDQQPQPDPAAEEAARAAAAAASHVQQPAPDEFTAPADAAALKDSEWARRYNSMRGRYVAMENQMRELGQELVRTQNILADVQAAQVAAPRSTPLGQDHGNLITDADRESYGEELIDLARRAGREALAPELDALRAENAKLTQRVQSTGRRELFERMDQAVPQWRQINKDTRFLAWLRLPNVYTGQLRGNILKTAVDGANAPQALQVFRDFLAEAHATGMIAPAQQIEPQAAPAPRAPALALDALAAPGRARPASGDSQVPGEKPIYSRADIAKFYDDKRRGFYAGREPEVQAFEADLTAAQREGRIR